MSMLTGVAAGIGEGLMATGRLFGEQALNEQRASLELEKQKALEQFRIDQKNTERQRIGGIVQQARTSAMEAGPVTPRMQDQAATQALINSGDIDAAAALDRLNESGMKTTPWGSVTHDGAGNVIYDNASEMKSSLQKQAADAKTAAIAAKGQPKQLTQEQIDRITTQSKKIAQDNFGMTKNPFAMPGEDPKTAADTAKITLVSNSLGTIAANAAASGQTINPNQAFAELKPIADKYDQKVTTEARKFGDQFFDEKGRLKEGALPALQKLNLPDSAMQDKASFMRYYRDTMLSDVSQFNAFRKDGASQGGGKQSSPAAESKPSAEPSTASAAQPAKQSIVQQVRAPSKADSLGATFAERQSNLQDRMKRADADPELQSLMTKKAQALRDGKAVLANNFIAQYNQLRKERYGL